MKLSKPIEHSTGVKANWTEIIQINIDCLNKKAWVSRGYWISEVARKEGKQPVFIKETGIAGKDFSAIVDNLENIKNIVYDLDVVKKEIL